VSSILTGVIYPVVGWPDLPRLRFIDFVRKFADVAIVAGESFSPQDESDKFVEPTKNSNKTSRCGG
jgi:hypothetical protein